MAQLACPLPDLGFDFGQGAPAIDPGLTLPEQVQVRPI
jgi:hypothetical protein